MKIAIIEFNNCHFETLMTWIEYAILKNYDYKIFVDIENIKNNWLDYYNTIVNIKDNIVLINELKKTIDDYDILFMNTSHIINTTNTFIKELKNYNKKTIFIHHYDKCLFKNTYNNIIVTPLLKKMIKKNIKNNSISYILPIFNVREISKENYKYLFCFIGNMRHRELIYFQKILDLSNIYNFKILYMGNYFGIENYDFKNYNNFVHFKNLSSIKFIEHLSYVKYLLPIINNKKCYSKKRLTGIIPLSINFNIPLIINSKIADIYNFKDINSIIFNDNNFNEIIIKIINCEYNYLSLKKNLVNLNKNIINNNNNIIDDIVCKIKRSL
jgi:hypothetical protein